MLGFGLGLGLTVNPTEGKRSLTSMLFGGGEDGFLFGNFAELDELFAFSVGPLNVAANDDPVGMALDDHGWQANTVDGELALRTERLRTTDPSTAVVGTPGTLPANWSDRNGGAPGTGTVARSVVAVGVEGGVPYADIRFSGTFGSSGSFYTGIYFEAGTYVTTTNGEPWLFQLPLKVIAGSFISTAPRINIDAVSGVGGYLNTPASSVLATLDGTKQTFKVPAVVNHASAAFVRPNLSIAGLADTPIDVTVRFYPPSLKVLPGKHAVQSTSANRPTWKANAGKPYLLLDGTSDALIGSFIPMASGTGLTMAIAFNSTQGAVQTIPMGGGSATDRALIAIIANGSLGIGWGSQVNRGSNVVDLRNANHVVLVTGEASNRDIWLDGANITADFAAAVGTPASNGGPIAIGGRQATVGGAVDQNMPGNIYAACGLNRRVTPSEIARITAEFQRTF